MKNYTYFPCIEQSKKVIIRSGMGFPVLPTDLTANCSICNNVVHSVGKRYKTTGIIFCATSLHRDSISLIFMSELTNI